eukprot:493449_1
MSILFLVLPYGLNIRSAAKLPNNKTIRNNTAATRWFEQYHNLFVALVVISGGCYPTLYLMSSNVFGISILNSGLSSFELSPLSNIRGINTVLAGNVPQLLVQMGYSYAIGAISQTTIFAFSTSIMSIYYFIIASLLNYVVGNPSRKDVFDVFYYFELRLRKKNTQLTQTQKTHIKRRKGIKLALARQIVKVYGIDKSNFQIGYVELKRDNFAIRIIQCVHTAVSAELYCQELYLTNQKEIQKIIYNHYPKLDPNHFDFTIIISSTDAKKRIQDQTELIEELNARELQQIMDKRKELAAQYKDKIKQVISKPLHRFTTYDISNVIKSWILNDINHIENSRIFSQIIIKQSLNGKKILTLDELLRAVLENALSKYMTQSSFNKMVEALKTEVEQYPEKIRDKNEQEIAEQMVDYSLNTLCQQIVDNDIDGNKIALDHNGFIAWVKICTGWDMVEIKQLNSVLLGYRTKSSQEIKLKMYTELNDEFDAKFAACVRDEIDEKKLDLAKLQLKIKTAEYIEEEQRIFMNIIQKLEQQNDQYQNFIQDIYRIFAQSLATNTEWMCFYCSNFNFTATKNDTNICNLCGITAVTSTIYALAGTETFAMVLNDANIATHEDEYDSEETQEEEVKSGENKLDLKCPNSIQKTVCPSVKRLKQNLMFYQSWINRIRSENNGKDD